MSDKDNLRFAIELGDLGYSVFPTRPLQKRPATIHGLNEATTDNDKIMDWWIQRPSQNVAVRTNGLLVLDIDGKNNQWLFDDPDRLSSLNATGAPMQRTPRGGLHYFFRQPEGAGWRNTTSQLARNVDTRADGGYVLVAPSETDQGRYQWVPGAELDVDPASLPLPPRWLCELLSQIEKPARARGASARAARPTEEQRIPEGRRNAALASIGGHLRRAGYLLPEIEAVLLAVNRGRCESPLEDAEVLKVAASVARYEPEQIATLVAQGGFLDGEPARNGTGGLEGEEDEDEFEAFEAPEDVGVFPAALLDVPGLVGELAAHNLATATRPQPVLALGAAVALLGAILGHKLVDPAGTHTNLYIVGLCPSGGGKENARRVSKEALRLAGHENYIGPESFGSHAGILSALEAQNPILFQVDELGRYLNVLMAPNPPAHLYSIITVLLRLFSSAGSIFVGDAYAEVKKTKRIVWPHACMYGTTLPETFYGAITKNSLTDGFVSRLLVFETDDPKPERQQDIYTGSMPESIIRQVRGWIEFSPPEAGNLGSQNPQPLLVPVTDRAGLAYGELDSLADVRQVEDEEYGAIWSRTVEIARKLGMVFAASAIGPGAVERLKIDEAAASWGVELATYLTRRTIARAREIVGENARERDAKALLRFIRERQQRGASTRDLTRKFRRLSKRYRDELLEDLKDAEDIRLRLRAGKRGPTTIVAYYRSFDPGNLGLGSEAAENGSEKPAEAPGGESVAEAGSEAEEQA